MAPYRKPLMGLAEVADYFGVSKQLAKKWSVTRPDWPSPYVVLAQGSSWKTEDIVEWGKRNERKKGEGPRPVGDPRPPSVQRRAKRRAA